MFQKVLLTLKGSSIVANGTITGEITNARTAEAVERLTVRNNAGTALGNYNIVIDTSMPSSNITTNTIYFVY